MSNKQTSYYPVKNHIKEISLSQETIIDLVISDSTIIYVFSHVDCRIAFNESTSIDNGVYVQAGVPQYFAVRKQYPKVVVKAVDEVGNIEVCECVI